MLYTVYVLYSPLHDTVYIGYTSNLLERFKSHQSLGKGWTVRFRPWVVVYCEYFLSKAEAIKREKALKSGRGRDWIHLKIRTEYQLRGFISA